MKKVASFSWGELEAGGSNVGDTAIFRSQYQDLINAGCQVGVLTADPDRTLKRYPGVKCFDVSRSRLLAILKAVFWSNIVVVGGGELVQDQSSLLYSPFNLLPLFLAFICGKKSYAWAVGIGQGRETGVFTRCLTRLALKTVKGVSVRDRGSFNSLYWLGVREPEMKLVSDCALVPDYAAVEKGKFLGAVPRNVSNRTRHLLPLELRRKLGVHKEVDPTKAVSAWSTLLDWHIKKYDSDVILFPFHTGSLSNDDHVFCKLVAGRMKAKDRVTIADPTYYQAFMKMFSRCRAVVTTPLHGAILAVATGSLPVAVPYASKCRRFMNQAGLDEFVPDCPPGIPGKTTASALRKAWEQFDSRRDSLEQTRLRLQKRASLTAEHFRKSVQ